MYRCVRCRRRSSKGKSKGSGGSGSGKTAADHARRRREEQQAAEERVRAQLGRAIAELESSDRSQGRLEACMREVGAAMAAADACSLHRRHALRFELSNVAVNALWQLRDWGRFHAYADRLDDCMGAHYPRLHPRKALILKWRADMHLFEAAAQMSQAAQAQLQQQQQPGAAKLPRRAAMAMQAQLEGAKEAASSAASKGLRCYGRALVLLKLALGPEHKETKAVEELALWSKAKAREWRQQLLRAGQ